MTDPSAQLFHEQEREKHSQLEKAAERSTYLVILGTALIISLPLNLSFEKTPLYFLLLGVLLVNLAWFRLLPNSFIGSIKTWVYFLFSLTLVFLGVHFSGGIFSPAIFLYYLAVLRASSYMNLRSFLLIIILVCGFLAIEDFWFTQNIPTVQMMSLWLVQVWALFVVAVFARNIFSEEKEAENLVESSKLQAAKKINTLKNEFVFIISNKLKAPVLELEKSLLEAKEKEDPGLTNDFKTFLIKAWDNTKRLSGLVNDLSDLTKIESQKLSLDIKQVSLNQIVGATLSDFNMIATQKGISFNYQPSDQEVMVKADPARLHEILANLLDNAIKYSSKSTLIQVSFGKTSKIAQINIHDHGWGIPKAFQERLFEKFYRIHHEGHTTEGTGLGLFVTRELVKRQGGDIWFESEENSGTSFHFTLPLAR